MGNLSSLGRLSPRDVTRLAKRLGQVTVGASVDRLRAASSTRIAITAPAFMRAQLGAGITVETADLLPALLATLKHVASMPNPLFYERQRRRASIWDIPRFLRSYDETLTGDLILPRGLLGQLDNLVTQAGSKLETTDERQPGTAHALGFQGALDVQAEVMAAWAQVSSHSDFAGDGEADVAVGQPTAGRDD